MFSTTENAKQQGGSPNRAVHLRRIASATLRWLHVYLSMVSFAVLLFFAVTGFTLNHPTWFENQQSTRMVHGSVSTALLTPNHNGEFQPLQFVHALQEQYHLHGAPTDLRIDEQTVSFSLRAPGYSADVMADRLTGRYDVTIVSYGPIAVLNDLHKGRDSGRVWSVLIDLSAILMILVSITGLALIWFLHKRRTAGLLLVLFGGIAVLLLYWRLVP